MKSGTATIETIDAYLLRVKEKLRDMPSAQVSEILTELRSHILDSVGTAATSPNAVQDAMKRLGPPEVLAEMYLTEKLMARAIISRSPWLVMQTLLRLAIKSVWAFGACLVSLIGYLVAIAFFVSAVAKPFYPDHDGLWWDTKSHILVGLGLIWPAPSDRELLGWWMIPLGLLIFVVLLFLTTRFARWNIRHMRQSRSAPFDTRGAFAGSRAAS